MPRLGLCVRQVSARITSSSSQGSDFLYVALGSPAALRGPTAFALICQWVPGGFLPCTLVSSAAKDVCECLSVISIFGAYPVGPMAIQSCGECVEALTAVPFSLSKNFGHTDFIITSGLSQYV